MKVTLIARTAFNTEVAFDLTEWEGYAKDTDAALLSEFAGRACYQSWTKPNPATATNEGYLAHIIEVDHTSVFEHGVASFYIQDVSRSLTHELIRHRHLSPSQESQRYVRLDNGTEPVVPPLFRAVWSEPYDDQISETEGIVRQVWQTSIEAYMRLVAIWEHQLRAQGVEGTELKKRVREAARCVLPNMTPTRILMTGNHRSWRHFLNMRGSLHADAEIRELAVEICRQLKESEPALYQDFGVVEHPDRGEYLVTF